MEVQDGSSYSNIVQKMMVVNGDYTQDPEGLNRVQIYIPDARPDLADALETYLGETDKASSSLFSEFPWAYTLFPNLKPGYIGFVTNINNENNQFLILGLDANDPINAEAFAYAYGGSSSGSSGNLAYNGSVDSLVSLIMPIMIHNEVGLDINAYPDGLTDANFGDILPDDNGGWSIGLIQWHNYLAFNLMHEIAKNDPNWRDKFVDKSFSLYTHIENALRDGNRDYWANKWEGYVPTVGSADYRSIKNMLLSDIGKNTQITYSQEEVRGYLATLQGDKYNVTNPAICIYMADFMNQYGPGLPNTLKKASECSSGTGSRLEQLDILVAWCKGEYSNYEEYGRRRRETIEYIKQLEADGKFDLLTSVDGAENLVDGGVASVVNSSYIPEYGTYLWPQTKSDQINCFYGFKSQQQSTIDKGIYHWGGLYQTRHESTTGHLGIDIQGAEGDPVVATGSGTIVFSQDGYNGGAGNCVIIQMASNSEHFFCYMHLSRRAVNENDTVKAGQVVGYVGNTGASGGNHLHLGLHIGDKWGKSRDQSGRIDPLPYLGLKIKGSGTMLSSFLNGSTTSSGSLMSTKIAQATNAAVLTAQMKNSLWG